MGRSGQMPGTGALHNVTIQSLPLPSHDFYAQSQPPAQVLSRFTAMQQLFHTKAAELLDQERSERQSWAQVLTRGVGKHIFPPMGIGSRRASLLHKTHALVQAMWLEMGSWRAIHEFACNIVSITSDQGVESGL
eukprot:15442353-Alexandrium_andersonii.AAC.1